MGSAPTAYSPARQAPATGRSIPEPQSLDEARETIAGAREVLTEFVGLLGVQAGTWSAIGDWIARHVEPGREPGMPPGAVPGRLVPSLRPLWHSLTLDLTLLLGEQAIERRPEASWQLSCDTPYADASGHGRGLWLLLESLPERSTTRAPRRVLPRQLMLGLVQSALDDRTPPAAKRRETAAAGRALFAQVVDASGDP